MQATCEHCGLVVTKPDGRIEPATNRAGSLHATGACKATRRTIEERTMAGSRDRYEALRSTLEAAQ